MLNFDELGLKPELYKAIDEMGFETTTPIQEQAIPLGMAGKDIIGQAQTGTGKTAAFSIPFLQNISEEGILQVLILTPTRELCIQVEKEIYKLSKHLPVKSMAIYGGQDITRQIRGLKNRPQIIVATPGRLMDHLNRHTIQLGNLTTVILDEADEMLNMGFLEDIETILKECPIEKQMMMFSATMRPEIERIANTFMVEPELVKIKSAELTVPKIKQIGYIVPEEEKFTLLSRLLDMMVPDLAMVFGRTKRRVDELTRALQKLGYRAEGLHGDLSQYQRDNVMNKFRANQINVLVATDVAARGLDVSGVSHVFNFDLPQDADSYVHRIGRTGRAGNEGLAMSFIVPRERGHLSYIEKTIRTTLEMASIPTEKDTSKKRNEILISSVVRAIQEGTLTNYKETAQELIETYGAEESLSAMLKILGGNTNREKEVRKIKLTAERPVFSKHHDNYGKKRGGKGRGFSGGFSGGGKKYRDNRDSRDNRDRDKNKKFNGKKEFKKKFSPKKDKWS